MFILYEGSLFNLIEADNLVKTKEKREIPSKKINILNCKHGCIEPLELLLYMLLLPDTELPNLTCNCTQGQLRTTATKTIDYHRYSRIPSSLIATGSKHALYRDEYTCTELSLNIASEMQPSVSVCSLPLPAEWLSI